MSLCSFGDYMIQFYGLMPLLKMDRRLAILWHEGMAFGWIKDAYEDCYHKHYIGYRKLKTYTTEAMDKLGYGYITNEADGMIYYWAIQLPDHLQGIDITYQP